MREMLYLHCHREWFTWGQIDHIIRTKAKCDPQHGRHLSSGTRTTQATVFVRPLHGRCDAQEEASRIMPSDG